MPVIALRLKDVDPSDAFAYELSTRQWIDAFDGWDKSIDLLVSRIAQNSGAEPPARVGPSARGAAFLSRRSTVLAVAVGVLVLASAAGAWWWLKPSPAAAHSMTVRLAGFKPLSTDLPATIRDLVDSEIAAAFNAEVSSASRPRRRQRPGAVPLMRWAGRSSERATPSASVPPRRTSGSGRDLVDRQFNYDGTGGIESSAPHCGGCRNVVRCGLFGAFTYGKALPDPVLHDYMQFCQGHWNPNLGEGRKALVPASGRCSLAFPISPGAGRGFAGARLKVAMNADNSQLGRGGAR